MGKKSTGEATIKDHELILMEFKNITEHHVDPLLVEQFKYFAHQWLILQLCTFFVILLLVFVLALKIHVKRD